MPVSLPPRGSSDEVTQRLTFLRPYIVWRRRKRRLDETRLLEEIIAEEKRNITARKEKRIQECQLHEAKKQKIKEELEEVKHKTEDLEKRLRGLNDEKHELFMKLKCVLMTEDNQKKIRMAKESGGQQSTAPAQQSQQQPTLPVVSPGMKRSGMGYHGNIDISVSHGPATSGTFDPIYGMRGVAMPTHPNKPQVAARYDGMTSHGQGNVVRPPYQHRSWHSSS